MSVDISIIVPAYNERKRLPAFVELLLQYCAGSDQSYEIILVDDGSSDGTAAVCDDYAARYDVVRAFHNNRNRGKGFSVKRGFFEANGEIQCFLDADGSVTPEEIEKNLHWLKDGGYDVFIGSRVLHDAAQQLRVRWYRRIFGIVFNGLIRLFLFDAIKDTQCGFKMFKRSVIRPLFSRMHLERFGFDIELLYLACKMGFHIKEGPVSWHHVDGSKVNLLTDSFRMFMNILQVRVWHCTPVNPLGEYMGPDEYRYMYELEKTHWWFVSKRRLVMDLVLGEASSPDAILDVGCGTGATLQALKTIGSGNVHGVDASAQAISFCQQNQLEQVSVCTAEAIQYPDKSFGMATCLDVLEHLPEPGKALIEIRRLLSDRGVLIITVPAFNWLWSCHDEALCHLRRYTPKMLRQQLEDAGFKVKRTGYFFFATFFAVVPVRLLRRLLPAKARTHSDTTTLPPSFLNRIMVMLFDVERLVARYLSLPVGTSIFCVAEKGQE